MTFLRRLFPRAWILAPVGVLAFTVWADFVRLKHVEFVSGLEGKDARVDPQTPTGYADGKRWLIVPEHDNPTYQWIEETQLMLARGDWRVRRVNYENSPFGREEHAASPYRWWLVLLAWIDHAVSHQSLGLGVERAALFADPLLHVALLVMATIFVAGRFGPFCAVLFSLGLGTLYPLAAAFLPGVANDFGLAQICVLASVLLLVAGTMARPRVSRWYFAGGVAGGCGLWLSAMIQVPIIVGIAGGAFLAAFVARGSPKEPPAELANLPPWRAWAFGGAISSLLAYLIEYFPGHMELQLRVNYPLYGLAWLGLGELLWRFEDWMRGEKPLAGLRDVGLSILSAAAVAGLPVAIWRSGDRAFLTDDLLSTRLTNLPDGVVANGLSAWFGRDGSGGAFAAAMLPLLLLGPAVWFLFRNRTGLVHRQAIAIALGPVLATLAFAIQKLRWLNTFDAVLLALLVATTTAVSAATNPRCSRWLWSALVGAILVFGAMQLVPATEAGGANVIRLTRAEIEGLQERALAQWIADHAGPEGATVLVPPFRTSSFCFYGGLRGLGTQNWENAAGLSATLHLATSVWRDESLLIVKQRQVTHIVLPSWDTDLDDFARLNLKDPGASFLYALHNTAGVGFDWLRALPYALLPVAGMKEQSVLVLEVTNETDTATRTSRFVEYLLESGRIDQATSASRALLRYPADLGSLVALAQLAKVQGDEEAFAKVFKSIVGGLSRGSDRSLRWDRRVSLAFVLALGGRADLSRAQVMRCMREVNEARLRFLTTESLYHFLLLGGRMGLEISDPKLHVLAWKLLPAQLRDRF